ncbi:hypothetical protein SCE1572_06290 [Sorangium cellulosum So0157-2]|uniref:Uncharacterized protein n=1 Tax=Sorangium cellulosum So0157-2 TaxID=1254432 RepID=S4XQL8_SORCE|nr:hypothetical protein SCE1572_06290 [Sorangium cellulosum So0157-2]
MTKRSVVAPWFGRATTRPALGSAGEASSERAPGDEDALMMRAQER